MGVRAIVVADIEGAPAGAIQPEGSDPSKGIFYICPCGCGRMGYLGFRGLSPPGHPTWIPSGPIERLTLEPSVLKFNIDEAGKRLPGEHWHGWLRNGEWVAC